MENMINLRNVNESNVKKKMETIMKEESKILTFIKQRGSMAEMDKMEDVSTLSSLITEYCEIGPYILHQPQFLETFNFVLKHYQENLRSLGSVAS